MDEGSRFTSLLTDPSLSMSVFTILLFIEKRGDELWMFEKLNYVNSFSGKESFFGKLVFGFLFFCFGNLRF